MIFHSYPLRFTVVPIALFLAMWSSVWIAVSVSVLVTWWDVYHLGLRTFGLGRIYDSRAGNSAEFGRRPTGASTCCCTSARSSAVRR